MTHLSRSIAPGERRNTHKNILDEILQGSILEVRLDPINQLTEVLVSILKSGASMDDEILADYEHSAALLRWYSQNTRAQEKHRPGSNRSRK